jgi:hypothetical protein
MQPDNESQRTLGLSLFSRMRTPQKKVETTHMLTEAQAWREIARRIVEGEWKRFGLCREIQALLLAEDKILRDDASAMFLRLGTYLDYGWAYTPGEEREARALAALWLALDAEDA